jgi:hypothetical protein
MPTAIPFWKAAAFLKAGQRRANHLAAATAIDPALFDRSAMNRAVIVVATADRTLRAEQTLLYRFGCRSDHAGHAMTAFP